MRVRTTHCVYDAHTTMRRIRHCRSKWSWNKEGSVSVSAVGSEVVCRGVLQDVDEVVVRREGDTQSWFEPEVNVKVGARFCNRRFVVPPRCIEVQIVRPTLLRPGLRKEMDGRLDLSAPPGGGTTA